MSSQRFKTIAAIATPQGYGGIGVVRISGDQSTDLTRRLLRNGDQAIFAPNQASFHYLINPETGAMIDEVIITFFKAPHSFTGEDVIEISCHGSPVVLSEILRLLTSFGVELAQPGEFSLRAFLNQAHGPDTGRGDQRSHSRANNTSGANRRKAFERRNIEAVAADKRGVG